MYNLFVNMISFAILTVCSLVEGGWGEGERSFDIFLFTSLSIFANSIQPSER